MYDISCFDGITSAVQAPVASLDAPFRNTAYIVHLKHANIVLRIGEHNQQLDALLEEKGCDTWAWVTAANPGARKVSEKLNAARYRELLHLANRNKLAYLAADAVPDSPGWPIEPGLFLLGIALEDALETGRRFCQLAIVAGSLNHAPALHYCDPQP